MLPSDLQSLDTPFLSVFESTTDLIWLANMDGRAVAINPAARQFFGVIEPDTEQPRVSSFLRGEASAFIRSHALPEAARKGIWSGDLYFTRQDSVDVPVSVIVLIHCDDTGRPHYWSATARDITAHREAEHALQQALEEIERISSVQGRFINTMAHEFRGPLSMILSSLELLVRSGSRADPVAHYERMRKGVRDISTVLDRGLKLLDGSEEDVAEEIEEISLASFARKAADSAQQGDGRVVHVEVPQGESRVRLDAAALRVIADNLLTNALKFSTTGSLVYLKLAVRDANPKTGACQLVLYVRDRGIGIPDEDQPFIFERFYRCYNRPNVPGLGAGLYHVKRLVERMNGKIECFSRVGEGTEFVIMVPAIQVTAHSI
jgi:PAS domain S-box-containing protein